jgi:hypothetical protein
MPARPSHNGIHHSEGWKGTRCSPTSVPLGSPGERAPVSGMMDQPNHILEFETILRRGSSPLFICMTGLRDVNSRDG